MLTLTKGATDGSFMSMVISSYLETPYFGAPGATYDPRAFVYADAPSTANNVTCCSFIGVPALNLWTT